MNIGDTCPEFYAVNQHGNRFNSAELIGVKRMVLFFYPKDFTPGCTKEVCQFRDNYDVFSSLNCEVIGISSDSDKKHLLFSNRHNLNFQLLADPKNKIRKTFEVPSHLFGLIPGRESYVIDLDGKIKGKHNSLLNSSSHISFALECLKAI